MVKQLLRKFRPRGKEPEVIAPADPAPRVPSQYPVPPREVPKAVADLKDGYDAAVRKFYEFLPPDLREIFVNDAIYHKMRYLDLVDRPYGTAILEVGSDKPFITHCLKSLWPGSSVQTITVDVPFSPYPILHADIESEAFPLADQSIDDVIFTEVIEHLFRDPAWTIWQINRVLKSSGALFLTTPNACGYDVLQNVLLQKNPNERNQYYARIESGHPHLWTEHELRSILERHGFELTSVGTVDYYEVQCMPEVAALIRSSAVAPTLNGPVLRIEARKVRNCNEPVYSPDLFPDGTPVQLVGALEKWIGSKGRSPR
jgi:SAM-dependent methyltransferase